MKRGGCKFLVRVSWLVFIGVLFTLVGCGGLKTNPVEGVITYQDGTPMPGGGQITFTPVDPDVKISARGIIKEDGTYKMGTESLADGVLEGTYRVAIVPTPPKNLNRPPPGWPPLNKKYTNPQKSGLETTVTRGRNTYDITVEK